MSVIYMVRHGQASFGKENYDVLSATGVEQSRILAGFLMETGAVFDSIYSGTMERQRRTAEIMGERFRETGTAPPHRLMPEFNEYDTRSILLALLEDIKKDDPTIEKEMERFFTDRKAFQRVFEKVMMRWISLSGDAGGLETWGQVKERVGAGLAAVMKENGRGKTVLVVASGGTISAAVQSATGLSDEAAIRLNWQMVNSSVTRFMYDESKISLQSFNNFLHLELAGNGEMVTYR